MDRFISLTTLHEQQLVFYYAAFWPPYYLSIPTLMYRINALLLRSENQTSLLFPESKTPDCANQSRCGRSRLDGKRSTCF